MLDIKIGKMTFAEKDETLRKLYESIGLLSTYFAGLESQLIETVSLLANETNTPIASLKLDDLSFSKTVKCFGAICRKKFINDGSRMENCENIVKKLGDLGRIRNDILHSEWTVVNDNRYFQNRARKKDPQIPLSSIHGDTAIIHKTISQIGELLFDLITLLPEETIPRESQPFR